MVSRTRWVASHGVQVPCISVVLSLPFLCEPCSLLCRPARKNLNTPSYSCNFELVSQAGLILLCDYLCENIYDAEPMTWLIVNHVSEIIRLSSETPVSDFISVIHRNPAASGLFVQAVLTRCETQSSVSATFNCSFLGLYSVLNSSSFSTISYSFQFVYYTIKTKLIV